VDPEGIVRLIDAFINKSYLTKYDVKEAAREDRPSYESGGM